MFPMYFHVLYESALIWFTAKTRYCGCVEEQWKTQPFLQFHKDQKRYHNWGIVNYIPTVI